MKRSDDKVLRERMVLDQLVKRGIREPRILEAFRAVPRHAFVPGVSLEQAYSDHPLAIGHEQTISQPYMVAWVLESLRLRETDRVLEIGTGSGYEAALLSCLAGEVYSMERIEPLAEAARERLDRLGYGGVRILIGDGTDGWSEAAPYDAIVVSAAGPDVPAPLIEQLAQHGRLIMPVGEMELQKLTLVRKEREGIVSSVLGTCVFVPLVGRYGWIKERSR
jgi:protein-L-isoaspartate(D-aspartate) O-methyltransferase